VICWSVVIEALLSTFGATREGIVTLAKIGRLAPRIWRLFDDEGRFEAAADMQLLLTPLCRRIAMAVPIGFRDDPRTSTFLINHFE
jgi:hypothetical protein